MSYSNKSDRGWSYNLRSYGFDCDSEGESSPGRSQTDQPSSDGPASNLSEDARLLQELDLSSRQDVATYKPNPWTISKVNAASRVQKPLVPGFSKDRTTLKQPRGSIIDLFKKQAAKNVGTTTAKSLRPYTPAGSNVAPAAIVSNAASANAPEIYPNTTAALMSDLYPNLDPLAEPSDTETYRVLSGFSPVPVEPQTLHHEPHICANFDLTSRSAFVHSTSGDLETPAEMPAFHESLSHSSATISSLGMLGHRRNLSAISPSGPVQQSRPFLRSEHIKPMHNSPSRASRLLHSFTPLSSRISSATPSSPDIGVTTPVQGKGGNWTLSKDFSSGPKYRALPYGWPASRLHGHDGHTVSSPIPFGKMISGEKNPYDTLSSPVRPPATPTWSPPRSQERAMRNPPLPPSAYIHRSAAHCSDARPASPQHVITNDDTSHLHIAYTTKTPVIKKLISNPPRLARALSPPSQPLKRDAYAALNSPDSSWSSLPNTKKARTTKAKAAATAQSGKFKLPTSLVGRTKVAELTRNNLDEGPSKRRVVTYLPPPRKDMARRDDPNDSSSSSSNQYMTNVTYPSPPHFRPLAIRSVIPGSYTKYRPPGRRRSPPTQRPTISRAQAKASLPSPPPSDSPVRDASSVHEHDEDVEAAFDMNALDGRYARIRKRVAE